MMKVTLISFLISKLHDKQGLCRRQSALPESVVLSKIVWRSVVMFFKQDKSEFVTRTTFFKDKSQKRNITEFRDLPGPG